MSESNEFCLWLTDEEDVLGSIENQMHEIKSCSSSYSSQGILDKFDNFSNEVNFNVIPKIDNMTSVSKSCGSLISEPIKRRPISRSLSCLALNSSPKVQLSDQITQYINILSRPVQVGAPRPSNTLGASKEEYLEEINNRLIRELEEKNATLLQLQENYEHLLLKYAEAQNKIDDLRFQSSCDRNGDVSTRKKNRPKIQVKNILKPPIYSCKTSDCKKMSNQTGEEKIKVDRPSTLPVNMSSSIAHKDALKAVTPTDSEGVSSVITSMSGHSKILTNFDDKDDEKSKKLILKSDVLEKGLSINDPFDKVKHWQNSLPPLELIERPDMAFYDAEPDTITSLSTRYHELPVSELENIPETPEWPGQQSKVVSQVSMKKYLRTLSLPSSLTRRNILSQIYKRRNNHTIDISSPGCHESMKLDEDVAVAVPSTRSATPPAAETNNPIDTNIILRRWKRPPFLRSASLPMYHHDSPRSVLHCDIPPLDLENLYLTDDETSPISKSNIASTSSFFSSHECSFQTLNSLNSCKATVSDYSPTLNSHNENLAMHKSTSITPDNQIFFQDDSDCEADSCNVCGEMLLSVKAASFHGIPKKQPGSDSNLPICRSFSFNTESTTPTPGVATLSGRESFEVYTNNLKARSQITMKALTAHVNNS